MTKVRCTVITSFGTYHTTIYIFEGITFRDKIQQLECQGIYNVTGIIEEV